MKQFLLFSALSLLASQAMAQTRWHVSYQNELRQELMNKLMEQSSFEGKFYYEYHQPIDKPAQEQNIVDILFRDTVHRGSIKCYLELEQKEGGSLQTSLKFPGFDIPQASLSFGRGHTLDLYTLRIHTESQYSNKLERMRENFMNPWPKLKSTNLISKDKSMLGDVTYEVYGEFELEDPSCVIGFDCYPTFEYYAKYIFNSSGELMEVVINNETSIVPTENKVASCSKRSHHPSYLKTKLQGFPVKFDSKNKLQLKN